MQKIKYTTFDEYTPFIDLSPYHDFIGLKRTRARSRLMSASIAAQTAHLRRTVGGGLTSALHV